MRDAGTFPVKRLRAVCAASGLDATAERRLRALLELIATDPQAPTSVTAPAEALDAHIADSLAALPLLSGRTAPLRIVDIGSGAGLPGLPLAVALEGAEVDLIESTGRKCRFLERAIARLGQPNARVVCARAEDWARGEGAARYEVAVTRAVAPLATLIEYASPLLRERGLLVAWKGARDRCEERQGTSAAPLLGMTLTAVHAVRPFATARDRHLYVFEKVGPTPGGIPRRAGVARKRPFGPERSVPSQSRRSDETPPRTATRKRRSRGRRR
jgi:16S rRNA (guanine527-N7)-methyltransferase